MGTNDNDAHRIRRAIALRHTPSARRFWSEVLAAAADAIHAGDAGDIEAAVGRAADAIARAIVDPAVLDASSVRAWLGALAGDLGADALRILAHADRVELALAEVESPKSDVRRALSRAREAVGLDEAALSVTTL